MKILIMTGAIHPQLGHNANLMMKLLPFLRERHEVQILSFANQSEALPSTFHGVPIHWAYRDRKRLTDALLFPAVGKLVDKDGFSDYMTGMLLAEKADDLHKAFSFDAVLASSEPFVALVGTAHVRSRCRKYLYMMDPPEITWDHPGTPYRNKNVLLFLKRFDRVFTTKYAKEALEQMGCHTPDYTLESISFPMVEDHCLMPTEDDVKMDSKKINLLFCGAMSKYLQRSPQYYLDLASRLDERFCLWFMGKYCEDIEKEFGFHTRAQVVTLPPKPYQTALNAMHQTDVLINIGNNVRVHLPSKIVEYMSTEKPIVNFYKFDACPTLDYATRYPLCLNINEQAPITEDIFAQFEEFCVSSKGKRVPLQFVKEEFADWTPEYIANQIESALIG